MNSYKIFKVKGEPGYGVTKNGKAIFSGFSKPECQRFIERAEHAEQRLATEEAETAIETAFYNAK